MVDLLLLNRAPDNNVGKFNRAMITNKNYCYTTCFFLVVDSVGYWKKFTSIDCNVQKMNSHSLGKGLNMICVKYYLNWRVKVKIGSGISFALQRHISVYYLRLMIDDNGPIHDNPSISYTNAQCSMTKTNEKTSFVQLLVVLIFTMVCVFNDNWFLRSFPLLNGIWNDVREMEVLLILGSVVCWFYSIQF